MAFGWLLSLTAISVLVAFNMFVMDALVRMRGDIKEIYKAVVVSPRGGTGGGAGSEIKEIKEDGTPGRNRTSTTETQARGSKNSNKQPSDGAAK